MTTEQGMRALDEIAAAAKAKVPIVQQLASICDASPSLGRDTARLA